MGHIQYIVPSGDHIRNIPPIWTHKSWVISHVPIFHITQPLDSIRYMVYNGYYKVMSNIPKMGHLPIHKSWIDPKF